MIGLLENIENIERITREIRSKALEKDYNLKIVIPSLLEIESCTDKIKTALLKENEAVNKK